MEVINLLNFLNNNKEIHALEYATCKKEFVNFLDILSKDEQFTHKIDLGIFYINPITSNQCIIVDGLGRLLSLSLFLHAVCESYKKTTTKNEVAISTIRQKYLVQKSKTKLRLSYNEQEIYNKIIFGERLSGKEKESPMFKLLHLYWSTIKEQRLQAANIFKILNKVFIILTSVENIPNRDLYYSLNKEKKDLDQLLLVEDYLKNLGFINEWLRIKNIFRDNISDINLFFKDFFITKLNLRQYKEFSLYELFTNYFETMLQYMSKEALIERIKRTATFYNKILNIEIDNELLKQALVQIKMHNGEDTYAYILCIYEDYIDGSITEATFLEILQTIDDYLKNRSKNTELVNAISFNELIEYLNAFITCK